MNLLQRKRATRPTDDPARCELRRHSAKRHSTGSKLVRGSDDALLAVVGDEGAVYRTHTVGSRTRELTATLFHGQCRLDSSLYHRAIEAVDRKQDAAHELRRGVVALTHAVGTGERGAVSVELQLGQRCGQRLAGEPIDAV